MTPVTSPIPQHDDEYFLEELDGEILLYHAGKTETLYMNESAAIIWYLCNGERSEQAIVDLLSESYPDQCDSLAAEVRESLEAFVDFGGITMTE